MAKGPSASGCALALALAWLCGSDASSVAVRQHGDVIARHHGDFAHGGHARDGEERVAGGSEVKAVEMDAALEQVVSRLVHSRGRHAPSHAEMTKKARELGLRRVNLRAAAKRLEGKLPADVQSLIRIGVDGTRKQPFSEESMEKARTVLNSMIEKSWVELDDELIKCKEWEDKNRGTYDQVTTDLSRIGEQLADLERVRAEATEMISMKESEIRQVMELLKTETDNYMKIYYENKRDMTIKKNDMDVFQYMMVFTKCKTSLLQLESQPQARICETNKGLMLNLDDKKKQAQFEKMLTPSSIQAINDILGRVRADQAKAAAQLLQKGVSDEGDDEDDGDDDAQKEAASEVRQRKVLSSLGVPATKTQATSATVTTTTTMGLPTPPVPKEKVWTSVDIDLKWKECPSEPQDCGLLHDKFSLMWGKYKDLVDELQMEMDKREFEFEELKANLNEQLEQLRNSKARFTTELNEAISNIKAANELLEEKEQEKEELEHDFKVFMAKCKQRIEWILYQDICAFLSVRAAVMKDSKKCPPEETTDCDMSDWVAGPCSVSCDDECPDPKNPYACGGFHLLTRSAVAMPNECGHKCSAFNRKKKCNQVKCPIDCEMSKYSTFSTCSADCGGGVQSRTRSVLTFPQNGGMGCPTSQESRNCNTGSCDRNCKLKKWSKWSPCSVACGGGFQEKWRRVTVAAKGKGKCPRVQSKYRYRMTDCNEHACSGDEICIATQDLVIAVDASGSLTETGFKTIKGFTAKLMEKYMGMYYGEDDMAIAVVQFGNGEIMDDGSIAKAKPIIALTSEIEKVKTAIEGLEYMKGFTNMAQAFTEAEKYFLLGGRRKAQSAVMTITDGKPSFLFQTREKVMQLKDKHIKLFFAPVTEYSGMELEVMKEWASEPWATHLVHIPGLLPLEADEDVFAQKIIVKFCPEAMSPSAMFVEEVEVGYLLVHENAECGPKGELLSMDAQFAADCAALATGAGAKAFSLGIKYARGRCYAMGLETTKDMIAEFQKDRTNPPCPGGEWKESALYDFYVLEQL